MIRNITRILVCGFVGFAALACQSKGGSNPSRPSAPPHHDECAQNEVEKAGCPTGTCKG